jgi:choloylglycine hydrolase
MKSHPAKSHPIRTLVACAAVGAMITDITEACTGITLRSTDGAVVFGRTLEWGSFDLGSRLVVVPRGHTYTAGLNDGVKGHTWKARHGAVGIDGVGKDILLDGMNEKGLSVNVFYHPGYASYPPFDPARAATTIGPLDVCQFLLTTCSSIAEIRTALAEVTVVGVMEESIGIEAPVHLIATEPGGKAVVIEFTDGEVKIHDASLGVITNAPNYDWHTTNLRNYLNLSAVAIPSKRLEDMNFAPLGGGSGMIGLPGDFTPPSRFIRAVAFSHTARPTGTGAETFYEVFRILDNFNVPLGAAEGEDDKENTEGMRSATIWTTAYDTRNRVMQYHTQHNRRVRQVDFERIDFSRGTDLRRFPLDPGKAQDILDVTPGR